MLASVTAAAFAYTNTPHALAYVFSESVAEELSVNDFIVSNLTLNTDIDRADQTIATIGTNMYKLQFPGLTSYYGAAGLLPDGNYDGILSEQAVPGLNAEHILSFFHLTGDLDHDRDVDIDDFGEIAQNLNQSGTFYWPDGDLDYDNDVDIDDYTIFNANYSRQMPLPLTEPGSASLTTITGTSMIANWTAPATGTPDGYRVFLSYDGIEFAQVAQVGPNTFSYQITGLVDGTKHWVRVRPYTTADGNGATTNKAWAVTVLPAPSNVGVFPETTTEIVVRWKDESSNATGFKVYVSVDGSGYSLAGTVPAGTTSLLLNTPSGDAATYYVQAVNATSGALSVPSLSAAISLPALAGPEEIQGEALYGDEVALLWTPDSGTTTAYAVEELLNGGWTVVAQVSPGGDAGIRIDGLAPQTSHSYRVRKLSSNGPSLPSSPVTVTTPVMAPNPPSEVLLDGANLSWNDESGNENGFRIQVWGDDDSVSIYDADPDEETFTFSSAPIGHVFVEAYNAAGSLSLVHADRDPIEEDSESSTTNQILLAFYGLGSTEWYGNQWLREIARRSRPGANGSIVLETENRGIRALNTIAKQLDTNQDFHVDASEAAGVRIKAVGYSWGAVEALNRVGNLRVGGEIINSGYTLDVPLPVEQVLTIDPVNFIKRIHNNAASTINIAQLNGGRSELKYWPQSEPWNWQITQGEFSNLFVRMVRGSVVAGASNTVIGLDPGGYGLLNPPDGVDVDPDPFYATVADPWYVNHLTAPWFAAAQGYWLEW